MTCHALPVAAQGDPAWSTPELVTQTRGWISILALIGDGHGQLHLFFAHSPEEEMYRAIDHMSWNGVAWSEPSAVLVNPDASDTERVRGTIDSQQVIHLVWGGGRNRLYYASAAAIEAHGARAWTEPRVIGEALEKASIAADRDSRLFVAYSDADVPGRVLLMASEDGGETWSWPNVVAWSDPGSVPGATGIAVDGSGRLHVVWTEHTLPDGMPLRGVYYAQSADNGETWSTPLQIDDEHHGEIGVFAMGNDVHLVWRSNIGGDGTFHQWSDDGGLTWAAPDQYEDRGGISGLPSFAVDSSGALHYVIGRGRAATFRDGVLGPYSEVVDPELGYEASGESPGSTGERAVMAITTGNRLHVAILTNFNKVWHSQQELGVPAIPTTAVAATDKPEPTEVPRAVEPTPMAEPTATSTMVSVVAPGALNDAGSSGMVGTLAGGGAAALIVGAAVVAAVMRVGRR